MRLQGNGRNHNHKPAVDDNNNILKNGIDFALKREENGENPQAYMPERDIDFASPVDRDKRIKEASEKQHASAYDDLDDYVYKQNKKRHRSSHGRTSLSITGLTKKRRSKHKHRHHHSKHHRHKKRWKTWQKVSVGIICVILALIIGLIGAIVYLSNSGKDKLLDESNVVMDLPVGVMNSDNGRYITTKDGRQFRYNENVTSILCMGVDKESLDTLDGTIGTGGSADVIFLVTLDTATGETNLINISRDTMTQIGIYSANGDYIESKKAQLCLAYAYGDGKETSCRNQVTAVRQLLYNVPINSYISLDLAGIAVINDALGGITVTSPETIGPFVAGEQYTLKGSAAQSFVRTRTMETVEGNNLRMARQKIYLEAFIQELVKQTKADLQTPLRLYDVASPYTYSNLDASKIAYLSLNAIQGNISNEFTVKSLEGKTKQGEVYAEFYPDKDALFELFLDIYYQPVA